MTTNKLTVSPGDFITVLGTITLPNPDGGPSAIAYQRGAVITVTASLLEDSRDRTGASIFDDLGDEQQSARWGRSLLAVGDLSASVKWWEGDASSAKIAHDQARYDADDGVCRTNVGNRLCLFGGMAGLSTIERHEQRAAIERAIRKHVPAAVIARTYGVSESAISRHKKSRMAAAEKAEAITDIGSADTIVRLIELAESTRRARQIADNIGSPSEKSAAQRAELAVLDRLSVRLSPAMPF